MPKEKKPRASKKQQFPCETCGVCLSSTYNLKINQDTKCGTEKNFVCKICQSNFLTTHSLKTHMGLHTGKKDFICSECGDSFLSKGQLKVHERKHTKEKPFLCGECGKGFSHRESLVTHSTIHTGLKPYLCESCNATFSCIGNLIKHRKKRPDTCGLPIYTNKKIYKRAGVKCKGDQIIVQQQVAEEPVQVDPIDDSMEMVIEEAIDETQEEELSKMEPEPYGSSVLDHQYVCLQPDFQDDQDFSRKEIDVFDYIGFEIRNIEEQEKLKSVEAPEQVIVIGNEVYSSQTPEPEIVEEETIIIEQLETIPEEEVELENYIEINNGTFNCKLCPKLYQNKNISVKHLKTEHNIILKNYNYDDVNRHRKTLKDQDWKCRFCPKRYTSQRLTDKHEKVHGPDGDLIYKCSCCSIYFKTTEEQEDHQYSEHLNRLSCESCQKVFDHPEKLVNHMKYVHSAKKKSPKKYTFVCDICGRSFNTKVALSDHERSSCGKDPIYQCTECNKSYHSAGSLKCHMTCHTNALNFSCNYCSKRFRTKGQVTVHERSHTKEKSFKCSHCPAAFSHRESLLTHVTLHTGIKRFECSSCGSRFSCISNLLAHRKTHKDTCGLSEIKKVSDAAGSVRKIKTELLTD